jgi:hypothetical protein
MPPAVVYLESDSEAFHQYHHQRDNDDLVTGGENWDEELVIPGRMFYMGQGHSQFLRIDEVEPGMVWPQRKKKKKKKKKRSSPPPSPASPEPAPAPAPIDWGDWEELCQAAPPPSPPEPDYQPETPWEPEDWEEEIACYHAAYHHQPEDWDAEIAASQREPEDWESEISPPWQPEDWESQLLY